MNGYWKMNIDLTRALVPSMGQHDPLDGYITAMQPARKANRQERKVYYDYLETTLEEN